MQSRIRSLLAAAALGCFGLTLSAPAQAQDYPGNRPVVFYSAFPPGGILVRIFDKLAAGIKEELGGEWILDYKPGGATTIAATHVARSPADGYTFLITAKTTHLMSLQEGAQYAMSDLVPVGNMVELAETLFVGGHIEARTLPELIDYFNERPGRVPVATGAPGTYTGTLAETVERELGVTFNKVPYAGSQLFRDAVVAGTADVALGGTLPGTEDFQAAGQIFPLAVFAGQRLPAAPDLPTFAELGYPGLVEENFYGIYAPAGTPRDVLEKVNGAIVKVLQDPAYVDEMVGLGFWITPRNLDELATVMAEDDAKLRDWLGR